MYWTAINAARCLYAFAAPAHIKVYPGAARPLSRNAPKHCPEIHGEDGLAGVVGLSSPDSPEVQARLARGDDGKPVSALQGMTKVVKETWNEGAGRKVTIVSTGPMTNIAVFISAHPELLDGVEQFVFMGGGNGFGNITPTAGERLWDLSWCSHDHVHATRFQSTTSSAIVSASTTWSVIYDPDHPSLHAQPKQHR